MCQALNLALKIKRLKDKLSSGLDEMTHNTRTLFNQPTFIKPPFWARYPAGHWGEREGRPSPALQELTVVGVGCL